MTSTELERASAPQRALAEAVEGGKVKMSSILAAMGVDPNNPLFQAMLLVCAKYGLDPLLGHVEVLPRSKKPYITRDGFLHIAHSSGQLDGINVDAEGESADKAQWEATVSVFRKDMSRPFTYTGRYPKAGSNKQYAREMAVKTAERSALKRAFNVAEPTDDDGRPTVDTSATVAEIEETVAVKQWVAEHGDPDAPAELIDEADVIDVPADVDAATGEYVESEA